MATYQQAVGTYTTPWGASAQMVLDQRGFESTHAVGELPADEQQGVVVAIMQREVGVMVLALVVNVLLLARAAMTGA